MALEPHALCSLGDVNNYLFNQTLFTKFQTILELLINDVTDWIEHECGARRFFNDGSILSQSYNGDFDKSGRNTIFVKQYPITFTSIVFENQGTQNTPDFVKIEEEDYIIDQELGTYFFKNGLPYGQEMGRKNILLLYSGGFTVIPNDLNLACIKMVAKEFNKRNSQGATAENTGGASVSWNEHVDPSAERIFRKYRRF